MKLYFIIIYKDKIPFMSIPTYETKINKKEIIKNYSLDKDVIIKIEKKDKFIGW
jgi:hypothetical protein